MKRNPKSKVSIEVTQGEAEVPLNFFDRTM